MLKLELFDESFDTNRTETYELSIQLSLNGFSFVIKDSVRNAFIALVSNSFEAELGLNTDWSNITRQIVTSQELLKKPFKKVLFNFQNPVFTVAPNEYFAPDKAKIILELVCAIPEMDEVRFSITNEELVSIFSIPSILATEWLKIQPKTKFIGTGESLLAFGAIVSKGNNPTVHVSYTKPFPYIALFNSGKLLHCNSVFAQNQDDTAYHTLNICQRLNLNIAETSVFVTGQHEETELLANILGKYFKSATISLPSELHHYTYQLLRYKNQFSSLFNLSLCE